MPDQVDDNLARRQERLQLEAEQVAGDLGLLRVLSGVGEPVRVGSAALGLMVHRDLDVTVVCPELSVAGVARIGATLAADPRVRQVVFRNDTGQWNVDPRYPDGLYLGVQYRGGTGKDWTIDVWFVIEPDRQPDLAHLRTLPPRLTPDARAAILRIKDVWCTRPEYGSSVRGVDIYMAVLEDAVRTVDQFDAWVKRRATAAPGSQGAPLA